MKIAVTGKGGVGKTTIAATLARLYAEEGHPVLAADVDPDANLGLALGISGRKAGFDRSDYQNEKTDRRAHRCKCRQPVLQDKSESR